jgi:hypothetical protein
MTASGAKRNTETMSTISDECYTILRGPEIGIITLGSQSLVDAVNLKGWVHMSFWHRHIGKYNYGFEEQLSITFLVPSTQVITVSLCQTERDVGAMWYSQIRTAIKKQCAMITWCKFLPSYPHKDWVLLCLEGEEEEREKKNVEHRHLYSSFLCDFDRNENGERQGFSCQYYLSKLRSGGKELVVPLIKEVTFYWKDRLLNPTETEAMVLKLQDSLQDLLKFPKDICAMIVREWTYVFPQLQASLAVIHTIFKAVPLPTYKELFFGPAAYEQDLYHDCECIESFSSKISHYCCP